MAVIGALGTILAKGPSELRNHHHEAVLPVFAHGFGVGQQPLSEAGQIVGQGALSAALVDVGIPPVCAR